MSAVQVIGVILIVLGVIGLIYGGISYTTKDKVDLGPVDVTTTKKHTLPLTPIVSGAVLIVGVILAVAGRGNSSRGSTTG